MLQRIGSVYLWIAPFLTIPVALTQDLAGTAALLAAYALFAALTAAAIWKIGATGTRAGRVRAHPAFLPGLLLLLGPLVLLSGAFVTGEPTAANPADYLWNTTAILLGSVFLVAGFVTLFARLWSAGQRSLAALGLAGLLVGAAGWAANLLFRYAVVASGASDLQAEAENRAWVAHVYLRGLAGEPSWMEFLLVWTDMLQLAFVLLSYLAAAAFGTALVRAGWLGGIGGRVFVALNAFLSLGVVGGVVLAGSGSAAAAWTAFVLTIPFMAFVLPYFAGVALLRRGLGGTRDAREAQPTVRRPAERDRARV